jgi:hypothetical protein
MTPVAAGVRRRREQSAESDENQPPAGTKSASTALLHPWKAAVTLPLSRSMRLGTPGILGDAERWAIAFAPATPTGTE